LNGKDLLPNVDGRSFSAGGTEAVSAGATDAGARVSGGVQLVYGFASRTTLFTGAQLVGPGGTASGTTISSGGTEIVNSAGMASGTTISRCDRFQRRCG
jgi:autotransporter passenger strand-loop-strand repeat protein